MKSRLTSMAGLRTVLGSLFPPPPRLLVVSWLHHTRGGRFSSALFILSTELRELAGRFCAAPKRRRHFPFTTGAALTSAAPRGGKALFFDAYLTGSWRPSKCARLASFLRRQRHPYGPPPARPGPFVRYQKVPPPPRCSPLHASFIRLIINTERTPFDMLFPIKGPLFSRRELRRNMQMSPLCF